MFGQSQVVQFGASCQIIVVAEVVSIFSLLRVVWAVQRSVCHLIAASVIIMSLSLLWLRRIAYLPHRFRCRDSRTDLTSSACVAEYARRISCCRPDEMTAQSSRAWQIAFFPSISVVIYELEALGQRGWCSAFLLTTDEDSHNDRSVVHVVLRIDQCICSVQADLSYRLGAWCLDMSKYSEDVWDIL